MVGGDGSNNLVVIQLTDALGQGYLVGFGSTFIRLFRWNASIGNWEALWSK